LTAYMI